MGPASLPVYAAADPGLCCLFTPHYHPTPCLLLPAQNSAYLPSGAWHSAGSPCFSVWLSLLTP